MREQLPYGPFLEEWRDIEEFENYYMVSQYGRIKSLDRWVNGPGTRRYFLRSRIIKTNFNRDGYKKVELRKEGKGKHTTVHQLVAVAFCGHVVCGRESVVNHKNTIKSDNFYLNLETVTPRENSNLLHVKSSSKYVGVDWKKREGKWRSRIIIGGKSKHLGYFDVELEASEAYQTALSNHLKQTA